MTPDNNTMLNRLIDQVTYPVPDALLAPFLAYHQTQVRASRHSIPTLHADGTIFTPFCAIDTLASATGLIPAAQALLANLGGDPTLLLDSSGDIPPDADTLVAGAVGWHTDEQAGLTPWRMLVPVNPDASLELQIATLGRDSLSETDINRLTRENPASEVIRQRVPVTTGHVLFLHHHRYHRVICAEAPDTIQGKQPAFYFDFGLVPRK